MANEKKSYSTVISVVALGTSIFFAVYGFNREDSKEIQQKIDQKADKTQVDKLENRVGFLENDASVKLSRIETDVAWIKKSIDEIKQKK